MITVVLNPEDMDWAERVGADRNAKAIERGWQPAFDRDKTARAHVLGAYGELAFCRAFGLEWEHRENQSETHLPDVDPLWEVRYSTNPNRNKARPVPGTARLTDSPDLYVAHVSGRPPVFDIYGYVSANWVQQNKPLDSLGKVDEKGNPAAPAHWFRLYDLSPIDPGWHDLHQWINLPLFGGWICFVCAIPYEGPLP